MFRFCLYFLGRLRDGFQRAIQDPGNSSSHPVSRPSTEHDRSVTVRNRKNGCVRSRNVVQGRQVEALPTGKEISIRQSNKQYQIINN